MFELGDRGEGRSEHRNKAGVHECIRGLLQKLVARLMVEERVSPVVFQRMMY